MEPRRFPCAQCGAQLLFQPGTTSLKCQYCGHENPVPEADETVAEFDFTRTLEELARSEKQTVSSLVKCTACAAEFTLDPKIQADRCPFCGSTVVVPAPPTTLLRPRALLPFKIEAGDAQQRFRAWLRGRWFAPSKLKEYARTAQALAGMYVPYWTFDCDTVSHYRGARGTRYTTRIGKQTVTQIRWSPVSGAISRHFDDLLVLASQSLPPTQAEQLEPWDLDALVPYQDEYLSGFRAERCQIGLEAGFGCARELMDTLIRGDVRRDIGGDMQRIDWLQTRHSGITFKHVLLPVWLAAYRFRDRSYRFLVNARTGEVQGERPYSWVKIALAVLLVLLIIGVVWWLTESS